MFTVNSVGEQTFILRNNPNFLMWNSQGDELINLIRIFKKKKFL